MSLVLFLLSCCVMVVRVLWCLKLFCSLFVDCSVVCSIVGLGVVLICVLMVVCNLKLLLMLVSMFC